MRNHVLAAWLAAALLPSVAVADDYYLRVAAGPVSPSGSELDSSHGWALGAGWRFNRFLSIEGGFDDLGEYIGTGIGGPVHQDVTALELGLAAKFPIGRSGVFGQARAGAHRWKANLENFEVSGERSGTDAYYGVGIGFDFNELFGVTLNYERYGWDHADLDRLMIGIEVR